MFHHFRHKILASVVLGWLLLTAAGLVARTVAGRRLTANVDTALRAAKIDEALGGLFSSLQDAETAERGYLLTGKDSYLEPFNAAEKSLPGQFDQLAAMADGNQSLQTNLLELRGAAEIKLSELKDTVKARQTNSAAALALVNSGKGKEAMDTIRRVVARMQLRAATDFSEATAATRRQSARSRAWGAVVGGLALGAGLLALGLVWFSQRQEQARWELAAGKRRAEKAAAEKGAFLANISHEIRTPMNAILGFGELLAGEPLAPRQAQYVRSIRQSGKSLLQLVSDVLDLSKLEAGKLELRLEPTDVREVCNFLQTMFAQQAAVKSLRLQFEAAGAPRALLLDRLRLRQVLVNLVGNAVKFTSAGHVRTRVEWHEQAGERSRGALEIHVEDTGVGIAPEKQAEIFKAFVQSGSARAAESQGAGLGLNIVQRLTQVMGGSVTLDSAPGSGSVFHLRFPDVAVSARLPVSDLGESADAADFNEFDAATLLVVDDNAANRELVAGMFAGTHHQVLLAGSGSEALDRLAETRPAVVLLDIRMPGMDGLAVLASIRQTAGLELLPVIAVTASSQPKDEPGIRNRFNGYIRKPFSRRTLYQELAHVLPRSPGKPGSAAVATGAPSAPPAQAPATTTGTARKADDWNSLAAELRMLQKSEWTGLRESLAINQTQAFARKLNALAQTMQCNPLAAYASLLAVQAETYAVRDLEKHLAEFPALVQQIEQLSLPAPNV